MAHSRAEYQRKWHQKNRERRLADMRESNLRKLYGITGDEYEDILSAQSGGCAICGAKNGYAHGSGKLKKLSVDHDHETGQVRGLLCDSCNLLVGRADASTLRRAASYLDEYE